MQDLLSSIFKILRTVKTHNFKITFIIHKLLFYLSPLKTLLGLVILDFLDLNKGKFWQPTLSYLRLYILPDFFPELLLDFPRLQLRYLVEIFEFYLSLHWGKLS